MGKWDVRKRRRPQKKKRRQRKLGNVLVRSPAERLGQGMPCDDFGCHVHLVTHAHKLCEKHGRSLEACLWSNALFEATFWL